MSDSVTWAKVTFKVKDIAIVMNALNHEGPIRLDAGVIWGQSKEQAEADCQRRLRETGR